MNGFKKMITSELALMVALGVLAASGITRPSVPSTPIQITIIGKAQVPEVQATVYSAEWCQPCKKYIKDIESEMVPDGWIVKSDTDKEAATAHVIVTKSEQDWKAEKIDTIPCTIIRKDGKEVKRIIGRIKPDELAKQINAIAKEKK